MCNACGFYCCAYDGFSRCGCEGCPEPECWDDDDEDYDDLDYGEQHGRMELAPQRRPRFFYDSPNQNHSEEI